MACKGLFLCLFLVYRRKRINYLLKNKRCKLVKNVIWR
nr:MAG TPA: hypothetical protein [Caudoviricetes sp.]DAZ16742.1 MAG TPA: hypothetical protein [Caudoviricetes sp.]